LYLVQTNWFSGHLYQPLHMPINFVNTGFCWPIKIYNHKLNDKFANKDDQFCQRTLSLDSLDTVGSVGSLWQCRPWHFAPAAADVIQSWWSGTWLFRSYLNGRTQYVRSSTTSSKPSSVLYGVPQGSVLGPILFLLYTADLLQLINCHHLHPHAYVDDTQIYGFCNPLDAGQLQECMSVCVDEVLLWMTSNRLLLNPAKTEVLWCSSARHQHQIPVGPVRISNTSVLPVSIVWDLGIYIDADLTMSTHVTITVRVCFAALQRIRSVRRSLTPDTLLTLLRALLTTSVDYCCSVLIWCTAAASSVRVERCRSTCLLSEEIRTHNSTSPWTALAKSTGENPVSAVCSDASLPT